MVYKGSIEDIENYFKSQALSQSLIKSPRAKFRQSESSLYYEEKKHFILGSLVDILLFTPERFDYYYYIDKLEKKPSPKIMSIIKKLFDSLSEEFVLNPLESYLEDLWRISNEEDYYSNRIGESASEDTRMPSLIKAGEDYWNNLIKSQGKQVLSEQEYSKANTCLSNILSNEHTRFIGNIDERLDYYVQYPIYSSYQGFETKILPDLFIINNSNETVWLNEKLTIEQDQILLFDLKTTSLYLDDIEKIILQRRYDVQLDFYKKFIQEKFDKKSIETFILINSLEEPEFPELIYVSTDNLKYEGKYKSTQELMDQAIIQLSNNYINPQIWKNGYRKANLEAYV